MIVVTIELWPKGDRRKAKNYGRMEIANVGGTETRGQYKATLYKKGGKFIWKKGTIADFPRKLLGAYDLVLLALISAGIGARVINKGIQSSEPPPGA